MTSRIVLATAFASLGLAATVAPARSQVPMPVVKADTSLVPWPARPIGTYDLLVAVPDRTIPATLVISDSAQQLVAFVRSEESGEQHAVTVSVKGTDLTLTGLIPDGALTLVLQRRDKKISGTWRIGDDQSGTLTGTMREH